MKRLIALLAIAGFGALTLAGTATAADNFKWLCKPGKADSPCLSRSTGTVSVDAAGKVTAIPPPPPMLTGSPRVDCFYVYPTVSGQAGANADLSRDPIIDSVANQQASLSDICRVFAPIYPQFTVRAILEGKLTPDVIDKAYAGVKAAWNEYLKKYNRGRGVILIGHSQGAGHLGHLIEQTFDRKPNLRKRLVSAVLIGGNVYVPKGKRVGGQFKHVPGCARTGETGCLIASSSFLSEPPPVSLFGRIAGALIEPGLDQDKYEIMCVNPARLDGSGGKMKPLYYAEGPSAYFSGLLPDLSAYDARWVTFPGMYKASCRRSADGARWLQVSYTSTEDDPRPRIGEPLGRSWGTHLSEVNDAAGNITGALRRQIRAYVKKQARQKKKSRHKAN